MSASARCSSAGSGPSSSFAGLCWKVCGGRSLPITKPRPAGGGPGAAFLRRATGGPRSWGLVPSRPWWGPGGASISPSCGAVATAAVVIVPVLVLLQAKYGIGQVTAEHPHPLSAPQAMLMAGLARGVFGGTLPWELVGLGAAIGIAVILVDRRLAARSSDFRMPVLAVALGIYRPLRLSRAILAGGLGGAL